MNSKLLSEDYACNLICEIVELTNKRMELRQESFTLRSSGFGGKADICDELSQNIAAMLKLKRDTLNTIERNTSIKYEYDPFKSGYGALRKRVKGKGWVDIARTPEEFKRKSETFISDFILGAYDSTDPT